MNTIKELESLGFRINWTLLFIGYHGEYCIPVLLNKQDIFTYAFKMLELMDADYELIAQLISPETNDYEFNEIIGKLIKLENVDFNLQVRKWRVYLVNQKIKNLSKDCFEGLISLTELWLSLGLPDDCPHIIQGKSNSYSPQEYYTNDIYELSKINNLKWIEQEVNEIISLES